MSVSHIKFKSAAVIQMTSTRPNAHQVRLRFTRDDGDHDLGLNRGLMVGSSGLEIANCLRELADRVERADTDVVSFLRELNVTPG